MLNKYLAADVTYMGVCSRICTVITLDTATEIIKQDRHGSDRCLVRAYTVCLVIGSLSPYFVSEISNSTQLCKYRTT